MNRPLAFWSLWLGVVAAAALLAGSGCSQEEYFCDATGCYYCDGVGCRPVGPPDRPSCSDDDDCPMGTTCTTLGCTAGCDDASDCPDGTVCRAGMCVGPTEPDPVDPPGCTMSSECDAGEVCADGACVPKPSGCQFNYECPAGSMCIDQRCRTQCDDPTDCPVNTYCAEDGFCDNLSGGSCTAAAVFCPEGDICVDGECVDACSVDADCGAGRICAAGGYCAGGSRPVEPVCTETTCAMGHPCVGGLCRTPCGTHDDCRRFDVQFSFCLEGYCATTNEATSNCTSSADCDAGDECIDGVCR